MPITPQSIIPTRPLPTVATGPITSVGVARDVQYPLVLPFPTI